MLETLKRVSREIRGEINRTWENLSEGWRELLSRGGNALTHFKMPAKESEGAAQLRTGFPSWSLLAGEVVETDQSIIVRLEVPGLEKEDCKIEIQGNTLYVRGEKRYEREAEEGFYHVMERAYGSFQRAVSLPQNVDADSAEASLKNGVLTVTFPKTGVSVSKRIEVK